MRRATVLGLFLAFAGCHAHQVASDRTTLKEPPKEKQVSSERPVRTTPGGMLDAKSMKKLQAALNHHGEKVDETGQLDDATQDALRKFQKKEGTAETGFPDYDTLRRLGLDPRDIYLGGTERQAKRTGPQAESSKSSDSSKKE